MELSAGQLKAFDDQGYVFFPNCFSENEIVLLRAEAESILKLDRQEVWREKTGAPRTAFAAHTFSEVFSLLARHPRLIEPLRQLFGEDVYVHQFKLNAKAAFEGDVWQWHQDYGTWARDDGMKSILFSGVTTRTLDNGAQARKFAGRRALTVPSQSCASNPAALLIVVCDPLCGPTG